MGEKNELATVMGLLTQWLTSVKLRNTVNENHLLPVPITLNITALSRLPGTIPRNFDCTFNRIGQHSQRVRAF